MLSSILLASLGTATAGDLPFSFSSDIGDFQMSWGFNGTGSEETIDLEFSLPSNIYIGIGLGCDSSAQCDMVVGNGGGANAPFVTDYYEPHGDRLPPTDVSLGGTNDVTLLKASYDGYQSTIRFRRKLNTGDKFDAVLSKARTPIVYAWCRGAPFCTELESPHAPGDWEITTVDLSGQGQHLARGSDECYPGSEALCACSELIKRGVINSLDDCTQEAAVAYCKQHGDCYPDP